MSLTKSAKNQSLEDALVKEDKLAPLVSSRAATSAASAAASEVQHAPVVQQPVMLAVTEKIVAKITRDGVVESHEIKGSLSLTASNDEAGLCAVQMRAGSNVDLFAFQTHPKINKTLYDKSGLLQMKDASKGFPSGRPVGILKWNYNTSSSDDLIPLKINCWPEEESRGVMLVVIDYAMDISHLTLHDVRITIPLGTSEHINVQSVDGSYKQNASAGEVYWELPMIDSSNSSGTFEFTVPQKSSDAFFPISVSFSSSNLCCNVSVASVTTADGSGPVQYGLSQLMSTEEYLIE
jgi:coatomer subunit delta